MEFMFENCHREYKTSIGLNRQSNYPKNEAVTFGKCSVDDLDSILHLSNKVPGNISDDECYPFVLHQSIRSHNFATANLQLVLKSYDKNTVKTSSD